MGASCCGGNQPTLKAIVFDLGGVLLKEPERNLMSVLQNKVDADFNDVRIFNRTFEFAELVSGRILKRTWLLGALPSNAVLKIVQDHIDDQAHRSFFKDETERNLIKHGAEFVLLPEHLNALTEIIAEGLEFVRQCKGYGIKMILFSNWDPDSLALIKTKFPELFDLFEEADIFTPARIGFMKPDDKAFEYLCANSNLMASEILFIDDSESNVKAARKFGIQSLLHQNWVKTKKFLSFG